MTPAQRNLCFAIAARLPGKPDLHDVFGVESLHDVSVDAARVWIDQHKSVLPRQPEKRKRRPRRAKGTIAPVTGVQRFQLAKCVEILHGDGWRDPAIDKWLRPHGLSVATLLAATVTTHAASAAITQMQQIHRNSPDGPRKEGTDARAPG